jgi:hypothetical protein
MSLTLTDSMTPSLSGGLLTQMIELSHSLRSLSAAATHLSDSLDRITVAPRQVSRSLDSSTQQSQPAAPAPPSGNPVPANLESLSREEDHEDPLAITPDQFDCDDDSVD